MGCLLLAGLMACGQANIEAAAGGFPTNGLLQECWTNIDKIEVRALTDSPNFPLKPDTVARCVDFESSIPDYNYGMRLRGLLVPPVTGNYTFWIASDDNSELWLSRDDDPAHKCRIARVSLFTGARDWTRYLEQRSDVIPLEAGKRYYIEALHKQGPSVAHVSVAWTPPGGSRELITGQWLRPWNGGHSGEGVTLEILTNATAAPVGERSAETPVEVKQLVECDVPAVSSGRQVEQRLRGYIHPSLSGSYTFAILGGRLSLSTDDTPANGRVLNGGTVVLEAGQRYYFEARQNDAASAMVVGWQRPDGAKETPITARNLTPYDSDGDGMPDWYEVRHSLAPHDPDDAMADGDSDGLSNIEEYRRGSDPQVAEHFTNLPPFLSVRQIRESAQSKSVRPGEGVQLRGTVTYAFNSHDFYLQDGTGGIFVEARGPMTRAPKAGDMVRIEGVVEMEGYSANVRLVQVEVLGPGVLPPARPVALDPLRERGSRALRILWGAPMRSGWKLKASCGRPPCRTTGSTAGISC